MSPKRNRISEIIVDETAIKAGSEYLWLWVAIEPKNKQILALSISKERNMFVAERLIMFGWHSWEASGFNGWWNSNRRLAGS
jgi:transposase-like protein